MRATPEKECRSAPLDPPYWNLFCSARQAITEAGAALATASVHADAVIAQDKVSTQLQQQQPQQQDLEKHLESLVREANHSKSNLQSRVVSSLKRRRHEGETTCGTSPSTTINSPGVEEREGKQQQQQQQQCLGLVAEAFADELDLLRKDEHFGGSARDVAAMADMMR